MPAPTMAAVLAVPSRRLDARLGQHPIAVAGSLAFAAGFAYILAAVGLEPEYARAFLPGSLLAGAGFGMVLGTAIGVAVLVALIDSGPAADPFTGLRRGWWFSLAAGIATAVVACAIGPPGARAPEPMSPRTVRAPAA